MASSEAGESQPGALVFLCCSIQLASVRPEPCPERLVTVGVSRRGMDTWDVTDGFCSEAGTPATCLYRAEDPTLTRFLWDVYFFFFEA